MKMTYMNQKTRIEKDITLFNENYHTIDMMKVVKKEQQILELASQYYQDSQYYLKKKDYFTAFGCINYAHGLLDAIIKF